MTNSLQLSLVKFKKGSYIIVEGRQKADFFYILKQGTISISKEVKIVEEKKSDILSPGDFFGVVSTMSSQNHIETARAVTDVILVSVHRDQFGFLIEKNSPIAMKIIRQFSKKMRFLDEALTRISLKSTAKDNSDHLFKVAEYYAKQNQYNYAYYAYHQYIKYCPTGLDIQTAKEQMLKIKPYSKAVFLDGSSEKFNRSYPKNTMIFSESQPGKELYIIQAGSVKITKIVNNNEVMLAILKPGDIFGEMSLLEDKPRNASATAYDDVMLLAVNKANFNRMVSGQPKVMTRLTQLLSERIWFIYRQLATTEISDPLGRLYHALWIQIEKSKLSVTNKPYTFDFGTEELLNMVGFSKSEGYIFIKKLFMNTKFRLVDNKIKVSDMEEIQKQAGYYIKMEKISRSRKASSASIV